MQPVNPRLERIAAFVKARLSELAERHPTPEHDPVYRWEHIRRVTAYGLQLALAEGADPELAQAACLLHDVAHFDPIESYKDHGRLGAQISRPFLLELGYPPEQVEAMCYAIAVHVDGVAGYDKPAAPGVDLLASLVSDADNIDRFGVYRILQWCAPGMADLPALAEKLRQRLPRLQAYLENNPLETASGRALFAVQLQRQIAFFQALAGEADLAYSTFA